MLQKKTSNNNNEDVELTTHKKRYISPEERQQFINRWINVNFKKDTCLLKKDDKLLINWKLLS